MCCKAHLLKNLLLLRPPALSGACDVRGSRRNILAAFFRTPRSTGPRPASGVDGIFFQPRSTALSILGEVGRPRKNLTRDVLRAERRSATLSRGYEQTARVVGTCKSSCCVNKSVLCVYVTYDIISLE